MNVGRFVVLPSTHIGSDGCMLQKMHDIIAISNTFGHLNISITINWNPYRPEIQSALLASQTVEGRPDLCDPVFCMKLKLLLEHLK